MAGRIVKGDLALGSYCPGMVCGPVRLRVVVVGSLARRIRMRYRLGVRTIMVVARGVIEGKLGLGDVVVECESDAIRSMCYRDMGGRALNSFGFKISSAAIHAKKLIGRTDNVDGFIAGLT